MLYLDILIGFSLIMLVFASAVSVAQSGLKRLFAIKGRAITKPLLDEIGRTWEASALAALDPKVWRTMEASLRESFKQRRGGLGGMLQFASVNSPKMILGMVRDHGAAHMDEMMGGAGGGAKSGNQKTPNMDYQAEWDRLIRTVESKWDGLQQKLSSSYERHTRLSVLVIAAVAAFAFNVDAVRILRVLSVSPEMRKSLGDLADKNVKPAGEKPALPATLSDWQKENLKELSGTGLPLGWETAPLAICDGDGGPRVYGARCAGSVALGDTVLLWLVRLLGLLLGAGLIGQGAPFWYSLLDTVTGLKKRAETASTAVAGGAGGEVKQVGRALVAFARKTEAEVPLAAAAAGGDEEPEKND